MVEEITSQHSKPVRKGGKKTRGIDFVDLGGESADVPRLRTNIAELDRVTGGGLVPGSALLVGCLLYTSPSPRDRTRSRMPSSA